MEVVTASKYKGGEKKKKIQTLSYLNVLLCL